MYPASSHFDNNPRLPDRRAHFRQPVRSLAYVELGDGNGGIALNISEGGMAVQAVMSLGGDDLPAVRVQLSHSKKQIQVKGRVAWTGDLRKLAGVQFVDLTEETRRQIREWISLEAPPTASPQTVLAAETDPEPEPAEINLSSAKTQATAETASILEFQEPSHHSEQPEIAPEIALPEPPKQQSPVEFTSRARARVVPAAAVPPAFVPSPFRAAAEPGEKPPEKPAEKNESVTTAAAPAIPAVQPEPEPPQISPRKTPSRTPRSSSFFSAAVPAPSSYSAPPRDPAPVPDDRFGFKRSLDSEPVLKEPVHATAEKWRMSTWVPIFVVIALAAGWAAGHAIWHGGSQEAATSGTNPVIAPDDASNNVPPASPAPAEIEVVDVNNHRWLIPMQTAVKSPGSRAAASDAEPLPQNATATNAPLSFPARSPNASDPNKVVPPAVSSSSSEPANVLPSSGASDVRNTDVRNVIVPPPPLETAKDSDLQPGELIHKVEPEYPSAALAQKVEGTVKILAVIDAAGNVKVAQPLSGPRVLMPAAVDAVRQWKYSPTMLHNQAIETQRQVTIVFEIAKNP